VKNMKLLTASMFGLFIALSGLAQNASPGPLGLTMSVLFSGYILPDGANIPQPVQFFIHPDFKPKVAMHAGDTVMLEFFADGKRLTSAKAVWHDVEVPKEAPGQSYTVPAQFVVPNYIWTNVPTGSHELSIRASGFHDIPAVTVSQHITVIAPLPPVPVYGSHKLTGKARTPLNPGQVRLINSMPAGGYEIIGTVTAIAPGTSQQGEKDALSELKKQAALMGANCVVIGPATHADGKPFSVNSVMITPAQTRVSGQALYLSAPGN
jgi:hypothetical protein